MHSDKVQCPGCNTVYRLSNPLAKKALPPCPKCAQKLTVNSSNPGKIKGTLMEVKKTSHALYNTKYHLVWVPKYRKWIVRGDIRERVREIFEEISRNHDFEIDTLEIAEDHIHIFLSFPPKYSIFNVVEMLKILSASVIVEEHPEVKKELWGGGLWEDGYFARTVGDKVTADVIKNYIKFHRVKKPLSSQRSLSIWCPRANVSSSQPNTYLSSPKDATLSCI